MKEKGATARFGTAPSLHMEHTKRILSYTRRAIDDYGMIEAGDKIAEAGNGLSIPAYASIDGRVTYADNAKVVIESV